MGGIYDIIESQSENQNKYFEGLLNPFSEHDSVSGVMEDVETTVVSYVVPAGQTALLLGATGSGDASAEWWIKVDSTIVEYNRTSTSDRNLKVNYNSGSISVAAGSTITLTVKHFEHAQDPHSFAGTLFGLLITN